MSEPRAQRTLVKSPPELWAEISDVSTLARHLGEFGDIRITRLEAETTVVWEGDRARGTVELEPSGWGTKVTITAEAVAADPYITDAEVVADEAVVEDREAEAPPPVVAEAPVEEERDAEEEPAAEAPTAAEAPPAVAEEPIVVAEEPAATEPPTAEAAPPTVVADEPAAAEPPTAEAAPTASQRRRGLLARLFSRRSHLEAIALEAGPEPQAAEPAIKAEAEPEAEAELVAEAEPEPGILAEIEAEPEPEILAEPEAEAEPVLEPVLDGEILAGAPAAAPMDRDAVEAVLAGVLDDLGSAHHRPFSRG